MTTYTLIIIVMLIAGDSDGGADVETTTLDFGRDERACQAAAARLRDRGNILRSWTGSYEIKATCVAKG